MRGMDHRVLFSFNTEGTEGAYGAHGEHGELTRRAQKAPTAHTESTEVAPCEAWTAGFFFYAVKGKRKIGVDVILGNWP